VYLIGLTGGIASGKSVVATRLAERGAAHIDADKLAREAVEPGTPALSAIEERFGSGIIAPDGSLDRAALGAMVFSDADALLDLNAITHPAINALGLQRIAEAGIDPHAVVVYDVPLLVEGLKKGNSFHSAYDLIVVVDASAETRIDRLVRLRSLSRDEALKRLRSQATDAERLAVADVVIDSNGTLEETLRQADALWETVSARA
jgi:dephospho-CoA kinase